MPGHAESLRSIVSRPRATAWGAEMADLPWGDPEFSERMLREHLDQSHEMASRRLATIEAQVDRLSDWLPAAPGSSLLDVTCGPGLYAKAFAERGLTVTGIDIAPAAVRYAREINAGLPCTFIESDVRTVSLPERAFDAAIYLFGQSSVARPDDLTEILHRIRRALRPGASLALEVLAAEAVTHDSSRSWWSGADDLFGSGEHLVLSERSWDDASHAWVARNFVVDLDTGNLGTYGVTERLFERDVLCEILAEAGFPAVEFHPGWDGLAFDGAANWLVAVAR